MTKCKISNCREIATHGRYCLPHKLQIDKKKHEQYIREQNRPLCSCGNKAYFDNPLCSDCQNMKIEQDQKESYEQYYCQELDKCETLSDFKEFIKEYIIPKLIGKN